MTERIFARSTRLALHLTSVCLAAGLAACASRPVPPAAPAPKPDPLAHYDMTPASSDASPGWVDKPGWTGQRDMIITSHPLATAAGQAMLKAGGSAVDAAIAAQLVLTLVEPQASGIGGGAFLLYADGHDTAAYDGRESAPAAASERLFFDAGGHPIPLYQGLIGGRTVGVPGVLRALELAHRAHGKLPWARLFQPAIKLAAQGFPIDAHLAARLAEDPYLKNDPAARAYFYNRDGTPKTAGTLLKNPALAASLRLVAGRGADAFYNGPIARDLVAKVRKDAASPGTLSQQDLAQYRAIERAPLCADYRQWRICGMPPPASGGIVVAQILGILDALPGWQTVGAQKPVGNGSGAGVEPTPYAAHVFSEAGRLAYADRARYIADPAFVGAPAGDWASLVAPAYLAQRALLIGAASMGRAQAGRPAGATLALADGRSPELPAGAQISVVDRNGAAVSLASSLDDEFGARLMVRGFLLNTALTDFSVEAERDGLPVANRLQPGKRPRSPLAPEMVLLKSNAEVMMVAGSTGGAATANYVAKTLLGALDWGMTIQQAMALPNFGSQNGPTGLEQGRVSAALTDGLKGRGHEIVVAPMDSALQGIQRIDVEGQSVWFGGADPRRTGIAPGG